MEVKAQLPKSVLDVLTKFDQAGYEIYIVGGAVRDLLMGRITNDWDFTTNATPEQILEVIPGGLYNNQFGTVFTDNPDDASRPHEITTFRMEEGYSDSRHPDKITWGKTLEDDLSRREATISAMALKRKSNTSRKSSISSKGLGTRFELIDPYNGQKDIEDKIFRAVGTPNERYQEDALRMMRAIRIATQLGFIIEDATFLAIQNNAKLIAKISAERIKEELFKIIASPHPYEGMVLLRNSGLMEQVLPELTKTFGVEQKSPGRHHIYDVGTHSFMALKECKSADPVVRFAALIHDIGKPLTFRKLENGTITFYNHELVSTRIAENIANRLRFSKVERERLIILVRYHQFTVDERQTDSAIRRFIRNVGLENVEDMLDVRIADRLGGGARESSWRLEEFKKRLIEVQKQPFAVRDLKIDGNDVMRLLDLKPGPKVGEILEKLFTEVVENGLSNEKEVLVKKLDEFKK